MEVQKAMFRIGNSIVNELVEQLSRNDSVDTGLLKNSIRMEISDKKITIIMNGYGRNVEYGRPAGIPISPEHLKAWCRRKLGDESLAYPIAKKIEKEGIPPRPFIRPVLHQKLPAIIAGAFK